MPALRLHGSLAKLDGVLGGLDGNSDRTLVTIG
jgi:hypothetical protein